MSGLIQGLKQGSKTVFLPVAVDEDGQLVVVLKSGNVVLDGPITVANQVEITNDIGNAVAVSLAADEIGTSANNVAIPAGGSGLLGWLSGIYKTLIGTLTVQASPRTVVGQQTLSVSTGAVATLTVPPGAVAAYIQADGGSLSITLDGVTAPTSTVGPRIDDGVKEYVDINLENVKLIARSVTTNAQIVYYNKA